MSQDECLWAEYCDPAPRPLRPKPKATSSRACSACHGFTNKEEGEGRCHFCHQDLPNKSLCTGITQHSQNDFSMGLVSLNSLHIMCRVDLCRERVWGFNTSGNPSYPFKPAHWHSGARIIVLNLSNLGRQRKHIPINSAVQFWGREGSSSNAAAEAMLMLPALWCVAVSPSVQGCIPHWNPTFCLFFPALGHSGFSVTFV